MSWFDKHVKATWTTNPDTRPGGPTDVRLPDPKRPGGAEGGRADRTTRRPGEAGRPGRARGSR